MKGLVMLSVLALAQSAQAGEMALLELQSAAGVERAAVVAPAVVAKTVEGRIVNPNLLCTMTADYKEQVFRLPLVPFVQLFKSIEGIAMVSCPGSQPVRLKLSGGGLAPGVGFPGGEGRRSVAGLRVQVPVPFVPQDLVGDYVKLGVDTVLGGVAVSPWINRSNLSANVMLYLPGNFGTIAAVDLGSLSLELAK